MELGRVFFTDGVLRGVRRSGDRVEIDFEERSGSRSQCLLHIHLMGCRNVRATSEAVGSRVEVALHGGGRRSFRLDSGRSSLLLLDDDRFEVLYVEYDSVAILKSGLEQPVVISEGGTLEFLPSPAAVEYDVEGWVADDPAFEFYLADGSRLVGRDRLGRFRFDWSRPLASEPIRLRELILVHFAKYGVRGPKAYSAMTLSELVSEGLRQFPDS